MDNHISSNDETNPFSIDFCKISAIQHILNGTPEFSNIFLSYISLEESLNIIQSLFVSDPPTIFKTSNNIPTVQHYRWMLSCFISQIISQIPNQKKFVLPSYYFNVEKRIQLSLHNTKTANSINKLVANPNIRTSMDHQIKLAKLLLSLYDENRPLFDWILEYKEISKYIKGIPLSTLFAQLNFQCFELYPVDISVNTNKENKNKTEDDQNTRYSIFDESEINQIVFYFKEKEEIESFFSIQSTLFDGKPIIFYQNSFFKDHPYPYQYQYLRIEEEEFKEVFSLLHTSFYTNKFFVDIVKDNISNTLIKNAEELKKAAKNEDIQNVTKINETRLCEAINNGSFLSDMQSWTFLSLFPDILTSYGQIYEQVECLSFTSDTIVTNLLERLKNDRLLFYSIHEWTGKYVKTAEFLTKSIPNEILDYIKNLNPETIQSLIGEKPLFCLCDEDKNRDCDFLNGYFAISNALKAISADQDFDQIQPIAEEIGYCVEKIISNDKKDSIITDIFSLLFLTKDDKFLFPTLSMQTILQILLNNSSEQTLPYLTNGLVQIQLFEQTSSKSATYSLSDLFISSKNKLLNALLSKNTVFAENLAKTSPENQKLYNRYKTVNEIIKQGQGLNIDLNEASQNTDSDRIIIDERPIDEVEEVAFSIEGQNSLFDRVQKESNISEVKKLTETCDYHKPFKNFKTFSKRKLDFLKEKLEYKNHQEWKIPTFIVSPKSEKLTSNNQQIIFNNESELNHISLLKGFFDYLDLLIPTLLSPEQTVESILNKSVDEVLDEFLSKEEFEKAEKLSATMKVDIKKKVLSSLKYKQKCYEHYCESSNTVLTTLSVLGNWKEYFQKLNPNQSSQKVLSKILNDKGENDNLRKFILKEKDLVPSNNGRIQDQIEFNDNFYQEGFKITDQILSDALESNDKELFIDLCYRSTNEQIEKVFNDHLNNDTIEKLNELTKVCPVSLEFYKKYQLLFDLHRKYSCNISNVNQTFTDLLNNMNYFDAMKLYKYFSSHSEEFDKIVKQTLQNSKEELNKVELGIVMVVPHMKKEILAFFNKLKVEEEESLFQNVAPKNWIHMKDFNETVSANIYNDPIGAIKVLNEFKLLDCDQIIIEYLNQVVIQNDEFNSIDKICILREECSRFIVVTRNPSLLRQFISSNLLDILFSVAVDSEEAEINLNFNLHRIINFMNSKVFSSTIHDNRITSLFHLCSQFLYMRFEFAYELNSIEKVIDFCIDEGLYSISQELSESFSIDITEKAFDAYLKQFRLYIFNTNPAIQFSLKSNKLSENERLEMQKKCSLEFAFYAANKSEFNGCLIRNILTSIENGKLSSTCDSILKPSISYFHYKDNNNFALNEQKNEVFDFFTKQSDIETAMKFYVTDIEKGFTILENLKDNLADQKEIEKQLKDGFITLFIASISFAKTNIFMKCFRQFDPNHTKYAPFLESMNNDLDSSDFPFLKLSISQITGDHLATARTALNIYTFKPELAYLDIAESSLIELKSSIQPNMHSKSSSIENNEIKSSQSSNDNLNLQNSNSSSLSSSSHFSNVNLILSNIERTLKKISLQRQFVVFCFERNLGGFESLNLFRGDSSIGSIVTLLFKSSEFHLALEILNTLNHPENRYFEEYQIEPNQAKTAELRHHEWFNMEKSHEIDNFLSKAAFSLANDGLEAVLNFSNSLQQKLKNEELFEKIMYIFIRQFELPPFNEIGWIKQIALNVIKNVEFKVRILIEIGEYDIAADLAIEKKNKIEHLLPIIANLSFCRSSMNAYYKCQKALESS